MIDSKMEKKQPEDKAPSGFPPILQPSTQLRQDCFEKLDVQLLLVAALYCVLEGIRVLLASFYSFGLVDHYYFVKVGTIREEITDSDGVPTGEYRVIVSEQESMLFWEGIYDIIFEFIPSLFFFLLILTIVNNVQSHLNKKDKNSKFDRTTFDPKIASSTVGLFQS